MSNNINQVPSGVIAIKNPNFMQYETIECVELSRSTMYPYDVLTPLTEGCTTNTIIVEKLTGIEANDYRHYDQCTYNITGKTLLIMYDDHDPSNLNSIITARWYFNGDTWTQSEDSMPNGTNSPYIPFLLKVRDKEVIWSQNDNLAEATLGYLPYGGTADINKPKIAYHFISESGDNVEIYSDGYAVITRLLKFSDFVLHENKSYILTELTLPVPLVANKTLSMNANIISDIAPDGSITNVRDFFPEIDNASISFQLNLKWQRSITYTNENGTNETSAFNVYSRYSMRVFSPIYKFDDPNSSKYNNVRVSVTIKGYIFQAPGIQPDTTY